HSIYFYVLSCTLSTLTTSIHTPISKLFPYTTLFRSTNELFEARMTELMPSASAALQMKVSIVIERITRELVNKLKEKADTSICRSEEHTSELQSHLNLVCRLLLEKKNNT